MGALFLALAASLVVLVVRDVSGRSAVRPPGQAASLEYHPRLVPGQHRIGCAGVRRSDMCSVLFIGNSYTYVNDLPQVFASLARSAGLTVQADELAPSGATLADHLASPATETRLHATAWNVVVLQDQSQLPADPQGRQYETFPSGAALVEKIRAVGAQPMFFVTPAHRDGWPAQGLAGYAQMQTAIDDGYLALAAAVHASAAPVGEAWRAAVLRDAGVKLWRYDGSHPEPLGTYLEACVFYATIFGRSPVGLAYRGGLPASDARLMQQIAAATVRSVPVQ